MVPWNIRHEREVWWNWWFCEVFKIYLTTVNDVSVLALSVQNIWNEIVTLQVSYTLHTALLLALHKKLGQWVRGSQLNSFIPCHMCTSCQGRRFQGNSQKDHSHCLEMPGIQHCQRQTENKNVHDTSYLKTTYCVKIQNSIKRLFYLITYQL